MLFMGPYLPTAARTCLISSGVNTKIYALLCAGYPGGRLTTVSVFPHPLSVRATQVSLLQSAGGRLIESRDDLVRHLSRGCKPKADWRIGTEHEKFVYDLRTRKPVAYEGKPGIRQLLEGMARFGWQPVKEGDHIIGLTQNGRRSLSAGAGRAVRTFGAPLKACSTRPCAEVNTHLERAAKSPAQIGAGVLGFGFAFERGPSGRRRR